MHQLRNTTPNILADFLCQLARPKLIMSDRFYDNKGIERLTKENVEWANRRYLQEEEEARQKGLDLQRQQVEAAERAAREAEQHRREQKVAEQTRLSELHRQGAAAQRDRNYQNTLLFLKESGEATRLDRFIEMLGNTLDWKCCPKDAKGYNDRTWVAERERIFSSFYHLPELPKECRSDGMITKKIKGACSNKAEDFLPAEALRLKAELRNVQREQQEIAAQQNSFKGLLGGLFSSSKSKAASERLLWLHNMENHINDQLRPFIGQSHFAAKDNIGVFVQEWIGTYRNFFLKSFFGQGLWINDGFQTRLQEVLVEIQKTYPTSCRADVNKLSRSQIETAYKAVVNAVVDLFRFKLSRLPMAPGHNMNWPFSYALFPDKNLDCDEYKKQEAVFLEKGVLLEGDENKQESDRQSRIITDLLMAGPTAPTTSISNESQQDGERS